MDADLETGYGPLIREYILFLESKLTFHRNHPEFNGMSAVDRIGDADYLTSVGLFEYEEYISLKTINDPNEGYS